MSKGNQTTTARHAVQRFIQAKPRLVLLIGAGVSIPSGIPASGDFLSSVLSILTGDKETKSYLGALCDAERRDRKNASDFVRFESLMELVQSRVDPTLSILDYLTKPFDPSYGHRVVAELMVRGHYVLTTNFDNLLECACDSIEYAVSPVINQQEFLQFTQRDRTTRLLKLHGSLQRRIGGVWRNSRESIQATLRAISRYSMPPNIDRRKDKIVQIGRAHV